MTARSAGTSGPPRRSPRAESESRRRQTDATVPAQVGPQGSPGPSGTSISALIGQERRVPTPQGGESPMPDSGFPVVPQMEVAAWPNRPQ